MAVLLNHVSLAAILGLAIGRIACAESVDMPQKGSVAMPGANAVLSQFPQSSHIEPPLRLALALNREKLPGASQSSQSVQEDAAIQSLPRTRPSHAANPILASSAGEADFTASGGMPQPPLLRPTLALSTEKLHAAPQLSKAARVPAIKLAEQAGSNIAPAQKETDTPSSDPARTWEISPSDRTLNTTLARWSTTAGWQLVWDMDVDYPIETRAVLGGSFQEAVGAVMQSLAGASVPLQATFYDGNRVLRVVAKGNK